MASARVSKKRAPGGMVKTRPPLSASASPSVALTIEALPGLGKRFRRADMHPFAVELNGGKALGGLRFIPQLQDREGPSGGVMEQARVIDGNAGEDEGHVIPVAAAMRAAFTVQRIIAAPGIAQAR